MDQQVVEASPAGGPPEPACTEDVPCPLCEYNLRGLIEPRCPECGYRFCWPDLLDPRRRLHPYLFEHHPERKLRSFCRTVLGGLRPRHFWTTVHPVQPSRPRRLILYWGLTLSVIVLAWVLQCTVVVVKLADEHRRHRTYLLAVLGRPDRAEDARVIIKRHGSLQAALNERYPGPSCRKFWSTALSKDAFLPGFGYAALIIGVWPWLTFATLMIFRWSMRRARVGSIHVLRCVLYNADAAVWIGLSVILATTLHFAATGSGRLTNPLITGFSLLTFGAAWWFAYRLAVAYRLYLRFDHPRATAFASQIVVFLFVADVALLWGLA